MAPGLVLEKQNTQVDTLRGSLHILESFEDSRQSPWLKAYQSFKGEEKQQPAFL